MDNPYLRRKNKNKIGAAGRKSEDRLVKKVKGRGTLASGAMDGMKGDIQKQDVLIEAKSTTSDTFRLDRGILCKITGEALRSSKIPAVFISFVTGNGKPKLDGDWALIRLKDFEEYLEWRGDRDDPD